MEIDAVRLIYPSAGFQAEVMYEMKGGPLTFKSEYKMVDVWDALAHGEFQ